MQESIFYLLDKQTNNPKFFRLMRSKMINLFIEPKFMHRIPNKLFTIRFK